MALLLSCESLSKSYGARPLFDGVSMGVSDGERLGLIGPNGAGKSTLLKIFAGAEKPDSGTVSTRKGARFAYLPQEDIFPTGATTGEVLMEALAGQHLEDYEKETEVNIILGQVGFDDDTQVVDTLSGGWRKRLALARALILKCDMVFLDEPTNHLDMEGILWLEALLKNPGFGFILITHDRVFLENVTSRMVELNRVYPQGYLSIEGNYSEFLARKEELLEAQAHQEHTLAQKVKKEVDWLRRGPQARTTKAQYRIDAAGKLIESLSDVKQRNTQTTAQIDFTGSGRKTRELIVAHEIGKSLGGKQLFDDVSVVLSPGLKLGLLGPNGSGKTSFLRILTGDLDPDTGTIKRADQLNIVKFDQNRRDQLDLKLSLRQALAGDRDTVTFNGQPVHVSGWAKRFLFRTEQLDVPLSRLSGGEQARVLIAQLMLQPADLLILDEPTNDLDIASLEVLEDSLQDFPGALILVTHDRYLLDRVCPDLLALDGRGGARFYAGYYQWEQAQRPAPKPPKPAPAAPQAKRPSSSDRNAQRLARNEQRELEKIEETILAAEAELENFQSHLSDADIVADYKKLQEAVAAIEDAQTKVAALYKRWEELEARK
ncbi:MAG: transporter related [Capsulimonas sp.]|jgi:ATP-binding cassette subfamily F protein uup|nr:transporter related [Capsulimonas sp.]